MQLIEFDSTAYSLKKNYIWQDFLPLLFLFSSAFMVLIYIAYVQVIQRDD